MGRIATFFTLLVVSVLALTLPVQSQRLVSKLSAIEISINSTFSGESLTLFGNVEAPIGANGRSVSGPFDIIIVIQGPSTRRVVREKTPQLGVWLNSEEVIFADVPAYYHVLTTSPLNKITDEDTLRKEGIGLVYQANPPQYENQSEEERVRNKGFAGELVRLMREAEMFGLSERRVSFLSKTFYNANLTLPANVPNGTYLAKTYLFSNGQILDQKAERFVVRTTGAERFIGNAARDYPLAYGLASVLIALFTGWLGAVAFRR